MRYDEDGTSDMRFEATVYRPNAAPSGTSLVVRVDGTHYVNYNVPEYRIPDDKRWLKITAQDRASGKVGDLAFPGDPTAILKSLAVATDFRFVGTEERAGRTLARYATSVDLRNAKSVIAEESAGYVQYLLDSAVPALDFVVSVDRESTLYHVKTTSPAGDIDSELEITVWGSPTVIEPPDDQFVATLDEARQ